MDFCVVPAIAAMLAASAPCPDYAEAVTLVPCVYEDDYNCYWDASTMGNKRGLGFVMIGEGEMYYVAEMHGDTMGLDMPAPFHALDSESDQ